MLRFIQTLQIVFSVIITFFVLVQTKGKGLSGFFGGGTGSYSTRRGLEKVIFIATIVLGVFLVVNSLLIIYMD